MLSFYRACRDGRIRYGLGGSMRIIGVEAEALEELTMNIVNYEAASTIRTR